MKYAHKNGCPWNTSSYQNLCSRAALNGHLEWLKYAHENGCPWSKDTCQVAAANGQLECLEICAQKWMSLGQRYVSRLLPLMVNSSA